MLNYFDSLFSWICDFSPIFLTFDTWFFCFMNVCKNQENCFKNGLNFGAKTLKKSYKYFLHGKTLQIFSDLVPIQHHLWKLTATQTKSEMKGCVRKSAFVPLNKFLKFLNCINFAMIRVHDLNFEVCKNFFCQ